MRLRTLQCAAVLHEDIARIADHLREQFGRVLVGVVNPHRLKRPALRQVHLRITDSAQRTCRIPNCPPVVGFYGTQSPCRRTDPQGHKSLLSCPSSQSIDTKQATYAESAGKQANNATP
ncbi:hypothetical protein SB00610_01251 [Klebsiella quasipneumoniae subsp. similipneumoniae]|nr:hypothetical protein SB00610_01251 [Klebsiella quasipneumoniae subsp. similipneumoniae]